MDLLSLLIGKKLGGGGGGGNIPVPDAYTRLEYLISYDGNSTAIGAGSWSTNRKGQIKKDQYVVGVCSVNMTENTRDKCLLGMSNDDSTGGLFELYYDWSSPIVRQKQYGNTATSSEFPFAPTVCWKDKNADIPMSCIWQAKKDLRQDFYICSYRLKSGSGTDYGFNGKVYRISVGDTYENDCGKFTIVNPTMDFIPVKRNADNVVGFYDVVNDEFYPSEGVVAYGEPV